ncbi:MAG: DUF1640 domain-containing protein [Gammaproteobacteria bacterium]|nr:DUF1640 domain-containing protein [Gammaproteobacteria bacterium]
MVPPAFDTHRAVKSLTVAGFSDSQAEAVVETVGTAIDETLATKADLEPIRSDLDRVKSTMATKADLEPIRSDLDGVMSTMATKTDLAAFEQRMTIKFGAMAFAGMSLLAVLQKVL